MVSNRHELIDELKKQKQFLHDKYSVERIGVFGSFAKDNVTAESDVDLVIEYSKPLGFKFLRLAEFLELQLGRKVDLLTKVGLENIRFEKIKSGIKESIFYV